MNSEEKNGLASNTGEWKKKETKSAGATNDEKFTKIELNILIWLAAIASICLLCLSAELVYEILELVGVI